MESWALKFLDQVCCSVVLQWVVVGGSRLQWVTVGCEVLLCMEILGSGVLQCCVAVCCSVLQCVAACCSVMQSVAVI